MIAIGILATTQFSNHPLPCLPVPQVGDLALFYMTFGNMLDIHLHAVDGCELVGPSTYRDGPLRVRPERQARDSQIGGLFLQSPGIGDDEPGFFHKADRVQVIHRLGNEQAG